MKKYNLYYTKNYPGDKAIEAVYTVKAPTIRRALEIAEKNNFAGLRLNKQIPVTVWKIEEERKVENGKD